MLLCHFFLANGPKKQKAPLTMWHLSEFDALTWKHNIQAIKGRMYLNLTHTKPRINSTYYKYVKRGLQWLWG